MSVKEVSREDLAARFGADPASCAIAEEANNKGETRKHPKVRRSRKNKQRLDLSKVVFTDHAIKQFIERFDIVCPGSTLKDPQRTMRKLLGQSRKEKLNVRHLQRLAKHDFDEVGYFVAEGWRFIVRKDNNRFMVVTTERLKPEQN